MTYCTYFTTNSTLFIFLPDWATVDMSTPCSSAMKPSTEKMAKPARKLVKLFRRHRTKESLQGNTHTKRN